MNEPENDDPVASLYREFLDSRNAGANPSVTEFLLRCPDGQREELAEALSFLKQAKTGDAAPLRKFGDFEIVCEIGRGGMGVVYQARQISIDRPVALKLLSPWAAQEPAARARLLQEALSLAKVKHPNIVSVLAAGEEEETPYLVMDLVEGQPLSQVLAQARANGEPIAISQILRWIWRIACGLDTAHKAGVIHRDVKPHNIRITNDGRAVLLDFGLAKSQGAGSLTRTGHFQGSPQYASPEQVAAKGQGIDARTDIYSLGITLYECVTGSPPFGGETSEQILQQILTKEPQAPRKRNRSISRDLETVILKAIEKNPAHRYLDAFSFAADLEALLELRPIAARPAGSVTRSLKWAARNPGGAAAIGIAALGILTALGSWRWQVVQAQRERAAHLEEAATAARELRFDHAISCIDKAIGLAPDDPECLRQRAEILAQRNRHQSKLEVENAREHFRQFLELRERHRQEQQKWKDFQAGYLAKTPSEEELQQAEALESLVPRLEREREAKAQAMESALTLALRLDPENSDAREVWADLYMEQWREAVEAGDGAAEKRLRKLVETNDAPGRHREEILGLGSIELRAEPPDAELYLFRYEDLSELLEDGKKRLAPIPVPEGPLPPELGSLGWRILRDKAGFRAGEILFSRHGEDAQTLVLKNDLEARPTLSAPIPMPHKRLGASPVKLEKQRPGSYLVYARKNGFEEQRLSFLLARRSEAQIRIELKRAGSSPKGFVFVPGGRAVARIEGTKIEADLEPFWIQELEMSGTEYLEFLNDPATLREIDASKQPIRFPRNTRDPMLPTLPGHGKSLWLRNADGRFSIPPEYTGVPVTGISYEDIEAYLRWRNEKTVRLKEPWRFSLPDRKEWYFAGSGADGRELPYGNRFHLRWSASQQSIGAPKPVPSLQFPHDESPFGVYDLAGNLAEFVVEPGADGKPVVFLCGGSWILPGASLTQALPIYQESYAAPFHFGGIRLIAKSIK